jgi:multidrug transporter EmrE-like cation transporter
MHIDIGPDFDGCGGSGFRSAVIMSYVVLNESVNWLQWLGVGITMFGIALPELMKRKKSHSEIVCTL